MLHSALVVLNNLVSARFFAPNAQTRTLLSVPIRALVTLKQSAVCGQGNGREVALRGPGSIPPRRPLVLEAGFPSLRKSCCFLLEEGFWNETSAGSKPQELPEWNFETGPLHVERKKRSRKWRGRSRLVRDGFNQQRKLLGGLSWGVRDRSTSTHARILEVWGVGGLVTHTAQMVSTTPYFLKAASLMGRAYIPRTGEGEEPPIAQVQLVSQPAVVPPQQAVIGAC